MYERNAIVIDRYFSELFGYEEKNNVKNNYSNYCNLVEKLGQYQEVSNKENSIMIEFERVANEIKDVQKKQESFYRRNLKLQETRRNLFDNLEDKPEMLQRKFAKIEDELNKNNLEIKKYTEEFINDIAEFNEKSMSRIESGRERRIIESEYQKSLKEAMNNFSKISQEKIATSKNFFKDEEATNIKEMIRLEIEKNGEKEKVAFDMDVIVNAIDVATDIEKKRLDILVNAYERTAKVFNEISNDSIKIERHKKFVTSSQNKLKFLNLVGEYIVLFLDNERMNVVGGKEEHQKLMEDAVVNFQKDLSEIKNLYEIICKEISNKASKKVYKDMYHPEYMQDLILEEKDFEKSISKLKVAGTIIYPDYWRIEGMQKIFDTFKEIITNVYGKDLSEYEPVIQNNNPADDVFKYDFDWNDEVYQEDDELFKKRLFNFDNDNIEEESDDEINIDYEEDEDEQSNNELDEDIESEEDENIEDEENDNEIERGIKLNFEDEEDDDEYEDDNDEYEEYEEFDDETDLDDEEEREIELDDDDYDYDDSRDDDDEIEEDIKLDFDDDYNEEDEYEDNEEDDDDKIIDELLGFGKNENLVFEWDEEDEEKESNLGYVIDSDEDIKQELQDDVEPEEEDTKEKKKKRKREKKEKKEKKDKKSKKKSK